MEIDLLGSTAPVSVLICSPLRLSEWQTEVAISYSLLLGQSPRCLKEARRLYKRLVQLYNGVGGWDDYVGLGSEFLVDRIGDPNIISIYPWKGMTS